VLKLYAKTYQKPEEEGKLKCILQQKKQRVCSSEDNTKEIVVIDEELVDTGRLLIANYLDQSF
jgi:hypothetical protein